MKVSIYNRTENENYTLKKGMAILGEKIKYTSGFILINDEVLIADFYKCGIFICNPEVFGKVTKNQIIVIGQKNDTNEFEELKELANSISHKAELKKILNQLNIYYFKELKK